MSFTLDWAHVDLDGDNTLSDGARDLGVRISTPLSAGRHKSEWVLGHDVIGDTPTVQSQNVCDPTELSLHFDRPVTDLTFELYDVDSGKSWDDKVTIIATNAEGEEVPVVFSDLEATHRVTGNTIEGEGGALPSIDGPGAKDSVTVSIAGPITEIRIIHDHGSDKHASGTVGLSDWTFTAAPERDGIVSGTDDDDVIVVDEYVDRDGDEIDNMDAIIGDDKPNDDRVEAGDGDDFVDAKRQDDTIEGGDGNDFLAGGSGNDSIEGNDGNDTIYGDGGLDADGNLIDDGNTPNDATDLEGADDTILGGDGNELIFAGVGDDEIDGGDGNDTVDGGLGDDAFTGGDGNDEFEGGAGQDVFTAGDGNDTFEGGDDQDIFILENAEVNDDDVFNGGKGGIDFDQIDARAIGEEGVDWELQDVTPDGDTGAAAGIDGTFVFLDGDGNEIGSFEFTDVERVICFTPGTLIATPRGPKPAEALCAGDRVLTRDNGVQEIAWYGQTGLNAADFAARPHLTPVLIRAGALGNGLPERDMMVSPQHRVLVTSDRAALYFEEREVLVAAKHLVNGTSILRKPVPQTAYIHFMCARHEVVLSDGAWTESFQPGDFSLKGIDAAQRREIVELFPELATQAGLEEFAAARRTLKRHEAVLLSG